MNSTVDCRSGNFRCALATMGCANQQISGQPASHVAESQQTETKCTRYTPVLGPGQYDLMIIGEAPALEDDRMDMAWVDTSGETIIEYLQKAGIDLDRVWMTKIVKCRPGVRGRKPSGPEIKTCRDEYLRKEIELIQPKVVMLVGAPTLKAFNLTGHGSMNHIHGRVFDAQFADWDESPIFKVIPTLNPAQFHYKPNPKLRARVAQDYMVAKSILDDLPPPECFKPRYHLIDTVEKLDWLETQLLNSPLFGWDTESAHLGFRKAPLISMQFAWGWEDDCCAVIPVMQHEPNAPENQKYHLKDGFGRKFWERLRAFIRKVFLTPHIGKSAHNHKYDLNVLRWYFDIIPEGTLYDTWVMKHLMDENPPSDLAFLCDLEFAWGDYEAARRKITGHGKAMKAGFDKVPDEILWPYGATDALGTYRLTCLYAQRLQGFPNLWKFHQEESEPLQLALARAEFKGNLLDMDVVKSLKAKYESRLKILLGLLQGTTMNPNFNPNSPAQVLDAFFKMGVPHVDLEEKKAVSGYSANKKKLNEIVEEGIEPQATFASQIMEYRNCTKMLSTYLENAKDNLDSDQRVRYSWKIAGPVTGRLACEFLHQIPKVDENIVMTTPLFNKDGSPKLDDNGNQKMGYTPFHIRKLVDALVMRDMFIAPEGYEYVYGDFSQVELRILAIIAQDEEMLRIMNDPNEDLHRTTAYEFLRNVWTGPTLTEQNVSKNNRTEVGKRVNFGLAYGSEGYSLVQTGKWLDHNGVWRNFTWSMLEQGMAAWKERFKGVGQYIDMTPDLVRAWGGVATNVFGRERHFGTLLTHPNEWERAKAEREAINFFIQSVAAGITHRTIIGIDRMLRSFNISEDIVCLVNTVHDSLAYEVRKDHVEWFKAAMRAVAEQPYPELGGAIFRLDVGNGVNWVDAEMS